MRLITGRSVAGLLTLAALACAKIEPPPGGPPDAAPPGLIATVPDSVAVLPNFSGDVEFIFNETVSEGGSANMGLGTGGLEKLLIVSPTERVPRVKWKRSRVIVRPAEGWAPNRVYRVELLPGVMDIRQNRSDSGRIVTFTTGAPIPTLHLSGQVWDWSTARPANKALVIAMLMPDSLRYRMLADSAGRFNFGPLPSGEYVVYGAVDQNRDTKLDTREAWDSMHVPRDSTMVGELWTFPHDTAGPRLSKTAVVDSVSAVLTFTQPLDPAQRYDTSEVRVLLLPDSVAVPVLSLLEKAEHDSLYRPPPAAPDSSKPEAAAPPKQPTAAPAADSIRPARAPLTTMLYLRVGQPWVQKSTYVIEIDSVRNVNRAAAEARGPLEIPEVKVDTTAVPTDSSRAAGDSLPPPAENPVK